MRRPMVTRLLGRLDYRHAIIPLLMSLGSAHATPPVEETAQGKSI
ncbi:hypothetical protein BQ8794_50066 [Mesorhizobium prunaredense]|uniref:Uncharacterized protein n=1 Tax=Mesorhizobium prunaredense TaxID=1631249 RepID=A0A1R3VDM6_9HYPH|nr:hypothetical protein BQ8794_50066 [Mesorhizobium prunaredense]